MAQRAAEEFSDVMHQVVTIAPVSGYDKFGKRTYGPAVEYECRIVEILERVVDFDGKDTSATTVIWGLPHPTQGLPNLGPDSRVVLPDGTTPPVLYYSVYPDDRGIDHHFKIMLGRTINNR